MAIETSERYCPICGKLVTDTTYNRFGEFCCSEAHAEEYVKGVRAQKVQAAALPGRPTATAEDVEGRQGRFDRRRGGCC